MVVVPKEEDLEVYYYLYKRLINPKKGMKSFLWTMFKAPQVWYSLYHSEYGPVGLCVVQLGRDAAAKEILEDGEVCYKIESTSTKKALLKYIGILPEHRRKGLGTKLMRSVIKGVKTEKFVAYVPEDSLPVQLFFRHCGWLATGIQHRKGREVIRFVRTGAVGSKAEEPGHTTR